MALSNYTELLTSIESWLNRADITATIPDFVLMLESRLNRDLRVRQMETTSALSVSTQTTLMPTDFLEARTLYITGNPQRELNYVTPQVFWAKHGSTETGKPKYYTIEGSDFIVAPTPDLTYTVNFSYYQKIPALVTNSTNWLLDDSPDIYIYGSLLNAKAFIHDEKLIRTFALMYDEAMEAMKDDGKYPSGSIAYRPQVSP